MVSTLRLHPWIQPKKIVHPWPPEYHLDGSLKRLLSLLLSDFLAQDARGIG